MSSHAGRDPSSRFRRTIDRTDRAVGESHREWIAVTHEMPTKESFRKSADDALNNEALNKTSCQLGEMVAMCKHEEVETKENK